MIELFKPEDFEELFFTDSKMAEGVATQANTKLSAYIQCLDNLYGDIRLGSYHGKPLLWSVDEKADSTHAARLIDVRKIRLIGEE